MCAGVECFHPSHNIRFIFEQREILVYQPTLLLFAGVALIAAGILSVFQVSSDWVLLLLLIFGGIGLFLVIWGGTKSHYRRR